MWEKVNSARKSQRMAAFCALCILLLLLIPFPVGSQLADWLNGSLAPTDETNRYAEITGQTGVTFDMDSTAFRSGVSDYSSYYVWQNTTGYTNYNNVTHTAGVISVEANSTAGNDVTNATTGKLDWDEMHPEFRIYFDYTAKEAYDDNVVRIHLYISSIYVSAHQEARTITLSAGGITFFTTTRAKTDTHSYLDENISIDVNALRNAIINGGEKSYWKLTVTAQDTTLSIAGSAMYNYNISKLTSRDDGLFIAGLIGAVLVWAGVFLVQPRYSLPLGNKGGNKSGGF